MPVYLNELPALSPSRSLKVARYFIGIALPDSITQELVKLQSSLADLYQGNPVAPENLHVTVLFLGSMSEEELTHAQQELRTVIVKPFTLALTNVETTSHIIWVTVPSQELTQLHTAIVTQLPRYQQERDYTGHITIARVKKFIDKQAIKNLEVAPLSWTVNSFGLYSSETYQEGPEYTLIEEYGEKH